MIYFKSLNSYQHDNKYPGTYINYGGISEVVCLKYELNTMLSIENKWIFKRWLPWNLSN